MKLLLIILLFIGCNNISEYPSIPNDNSSINSPKIVTIDSCEYIQFKSYGNIYEATHKGNCKYCKERLRQLLDSIITKR